jgi:hypothetical protein
VGTVSTTDFGCISGSFSSLALACGSSTVGCLVKLLNFFSIVPARYEGESTAARVIAAPLCVDVYKLRIVGV